MSSRYRSLLLSPALTALALLGCLEPAAASGVSLDERIACERAIDAVRASHRAGAGAAAATAVQDGVLRARVARRAALERYLAAGGQAVTGAAVQAELDRMVRTTKSPALLGEIFAALGNDSTAIAECLARPLLAERLGAALFARDAAVHGTLHAAAAAELARAQDAAALSTMSGRYAELTLARAGHGARPEQALELSDAEFDALVARLAATQGLASGATVRDLALDRIGALEERDGAFVASAVLARSDNELRVASVTWDKPGLSAWLAMQATAAGDAPAPLEPPAAGFSATAPLAAPCTSDAWRTLPAADAPSARHGHTATWTGAEMVVWGGTDGVSFFGDGAIYDLATDTWRHSLLSSTGEPGAPTPRAHHTALWTGSEVILWGGMGDKGPVPTGARYDVASDTWTATILNAGAAPSTPSSRYLHTAVWTGSEMIVWGGYDEVYLATGGRYVPATDSWVACSLTTGSGAYHPSARDLHTAVWTGSEMIVWGGNNGFRLGNGGRYNPATDRWTRCALTTGAGAGTPAAREFHTAVWTGSEMVVWGGFSATGALHSGARYAPGADAWTPTAIDAGTAQARHAHVAAWTGTEMLVWGGYVSTGETNTGGRYNPAGDTWTPGAFTDGTAFGTPSPRAYLAAVWVGEGDHQFLVWGGSTVHGDTSTGAAFCAACAPIAWFADADGDAHGNAAVSETGCAAPAGFVALGDDCDDGDPSRFPGNPEICDAKDNNCDLIVDDLPAPSGAPHVSVADATVSWPAMAGASAYDAVRGLVSTLGAGSFAASTDACLADDAAATSVVDAALPAAGDAVWYLVRGINCRTPGTYDDGAGLGQSGSRDAGIGAAAAACP